MEKGKHADAGGGVINWRTVFVGLYLYIKGVRPGFTPVKFEKEDYIVSEDDNKLVRTLGVPGKILYTPGHSPDSISLLLDNGSCKMIQEGATTIYPAYGNIFPSEKLKLNIDYI